MNKFSMTCTCGDVMTVDAEVREGAVSRMKAMMTPHMVESHMVEKHPGDPVPSQDQVAAMIEKGMVAA